MQPRQFDSHSYNYLLLFHNNGLGAATVIFKAPPREGEDDEAPGRGGEGFARGVAGGTP